MIFKKVIKMIQTIVLIENNKYPFGDVVSTKKSIKVQDIHSYSSIEQLRLEKVKMVNLFTHNDRGSQTTVSTSENINLIKLIKIYQEDLTLHFIYEYVPYSLNQYITNRLCDDIDLQKSHILQIKSKLFLKKVCYQLGTIANFLIRKHIKANLDFDLFGIDQQQNLKFFVSPTCQLVSFKIANKDAEGPSAQSQQIDQQLRAFYDEKIEVVLFRLEAQFRKLRKAEQNIPNFIIKGNQLIFSKPLQEVQSQCYRPSNFTQGSFTEKCQSVDASILAQHADPIRKSHGDLYTKLKMTENYNCTESNKKFHQNMAKLEKLRKKSKKLNQQLKNNLSNSQCFTPNSNLRDSYEFQRRGSTRFKHMFGKKNPAEDQRQQQQEEWRTSQMPQKLRQSHLPKSSSTKSPNRFGGLNQDGKRLKSNRHHKSSFQFKPKRDRDWFNPNKSFDKGFKDEYPQNEFQKSRSIRIEVEQKTTGNRERKSSFKVKILTCQQMQMDGENVQEFVLKAMSKNFNRSRNREDNESFSNRSDSGRKSSRSQSSRYSQRFKNAFSQKFKNDQKNQKNQKNCEINSKFSQSPLKDQVIQKQRLSSSQKNIFEKYQEQFGNQKQKTSKNPQLQEKIKLAKQKAEDILNKYLKSKNNSSRNPRV